MTLKMTLSTDLVKELGGAVEQVPTSMGVETALSIITVDPCLTVIATSMFSAEVFRAALHRWCRHNQERVRFSGEFGRDKFSMDFAPRTATEMATEIADVVAKFITAHPDESAKSASAKH